MTICSLNASVNVELTNDNGSYNSRKSKLFNSQLVLYLQYDKLQYKTIFKE